MSSLPLPLPSINNTRKSILGKRIREEQQQIANDYYNKINNYDFTFLADLIRKMKQSTPVTNKYIYVLFNDPRLGKYAFDETFTMRPGLRDIWVAYYWKKFETKFDVRVYDIHGVKDTGLRFDWSHNIPSKGPQELITYKEYKDVAEQLSLQYNKSSN